MALTLDVTNTHSGAVSRAGYLFEAGETLEGIEVDVSRLHELTDAPTLDVTIVAADSSTEIPEGVNVKPRASDAALKAAEDQGVDIWAVDGSGKDGQVTKDDVARYAADPANKAQTLEDHYLELHRLGGGTSEVTSLSDPDEQRAAMEKSIQELEAADNFTGDQPTQAETEVPANVGNPDQTGGPDSSEPSPPTGRNIGGPGQASS
jgi:pyruvate/2-oxoglutarate dehydrogenase complex dihydrolipoamide acyltransferase (E2) component